MSISAPRAVKAGTSLSNVLRPTSNVLKSRFRPCAAPTCQLSTLVQSSKHEIRSRPAARQRHGSTRSTRASFEHDNESCQSRLFSSTGRRAYKTVEEAKSRYRLGVSASSHQKTSWPFILTQSASPFPGKPVSSSLSQAQA